MRVVLVVPIFPQLSETFVASKAVGLLERGFDVHVVCGKSTEKQWGAFGTGHPVHTLRTRTHPTLPDRPLRAAPSFAWSISVLCLRHRSALGRYVQKTRSHGGSVLHDLFIDESLIALQPEVVHFEFGTGVLGRTSLRDRLGCAATVSFRGSDLNVIGLDQPGFYDEVWRNVDGIHVLGQALVDRAHTRGAPLDTQLTVIHPATGSPGPLGHGRRFNGSRPLHVLSVGRLHWSKGYQYALEAIASLRRQGMPVEYRVVGDGDLLEAIAFWRHQLGLDDVVHLVGAASPGEVAHHYLWADVVLHSAVTEGFGNVAIEAQAQGVPVVCTDAGGLSENVQDGVTGLVVPRRNPEALRDALERIATVPGLHQRLSGAGPSRVDRLFRLDHQLDAWERFYEDALRKRHGHP